MKIASGEIEIRGAWLANGNRISADEAARRIQWLISNVLERVPSPPVAGGWEVLYRDPGDGRFWEHRNPQGELHGGGPPLLKFIPDGEARKKYGPALYRFPFRPPTTRVISFKQGFESAMTSLGFERAEKSYRLEGVAVNVVVDLRPRPRSTWARAD
jgi:hypothetical protein